MWFTEQAANKIGRITTAGAITEHATCRPRARTFLGIAAGPDGALWFTEQNTHSIGHITAAGSVTEHPIPSGSTPAYIAAGPDGALWFTEVNDQTGGHVGRMTTDGTVTDELPIATSGLECSPTGITAGPDGNVWFTCELADQIGRIAVPKPAPPGGTRASTGRGHHGAALHRLIVLDGLDAQRHLRDARACGPRSGRCSAPVAGRGGDPAGPGLVVGARTVTNDDATLLWYSAQEWASRQVRQPGFYGRWYGSTLEGLPLDALGRLGLDFWIGLPVVMGIFTIAGWSLLSLAHRWRRSHRVLAAALRGAGVPVGVLHVLRHDRADVDGTALPRGRRRRAPDHAATITSARRSARLRSARPRRGDGPEQCAARRAGCPLVPAVTPPRTSTRRVGSLLRP